MNSLTWFIYLAGVLPDFASFLGFICFLMLLGYGLGVLVSEGELLGLLNPKWLFLPFVVGVLTFLIPDSKTMYMMAASESAGRIAQTQQAQDLGGKLLGKLDELLKQKDDK